MAVTVIDAVPHQSVVKEIICKNCGATLQYTPNDVMSDYTTDYTGSRDYYKCITCPLCSTPVAVQ